MERQRNFGGDGYAPAGQCENKAVLAFKARQGCRQLAARILAIGEKHVGLHQHLALR
jgi:hypothetical protein